jgi:hypothetical protein
MLKLIFNWLKPKGESLYAVIAGRIERVTDRNVNQVLGSGNKIIKAPNSRVAGQIAKQAKPPAGTLLTPAKQKAALEALRKSREAQATAGRKVAETVKKPPVKKQDAPAAATETKASKAARVRAERKAKRADDRRRAAEKKEQAAQDSKAAQESKVGTVVPSKARRMTAREVDASKNLPVRSGKPQLPAVTPKKKPPPIDLDGLQSRLGRKLTFNEKAALGGIGTLAVAAYLKKLINADKADKAAEAAEATSKPKLDDPTKKLPQISTDKAKVKPKPPITNKELGAHYNRINRLIEAEDKGAGTYGIKYEGKEYRNWKEYNKAWEKENKGRDKPEDPVKSFFKGAKKKITGEKKRGGGQVSSRPKSYRTAKIMKQYAKGGSVRKPNRI